MFVSPPLLPCTTLSVTLDVASIESDNNESNFTFKSIGTGKSSLVKACVCGKFFQSPTLEY